MPRALGRPSKGGQFFMSEPPLYRCVSHSVYAASLRCSVRAVDLRAPGTVCRLGTRWSHWLGIGAIGLVDSVTGTSTQCAVRSGSGKAGGAFSLLQGVGRGRLAGLFAKAGGSFHYCTWVACWLLFTRVLLLRHFSRVVHKVLTLGTRIFTQCASRSDSFPLPSRCVCTA